MTTQKLFLTLLFALGSNFTFASDLTPALASRRKIPVQN